MLLSLLSFFGVLSLPLVLVFLVLEIIADWKIFQKAGEPGWKSIIPVYNEYTAYRIVWRVEFFWISFALNLLAGILQSWYEDSTASTADGILIMIPSMLAAILGIVYSVKTARAFGKGTGFILGLIFLNPVFRIILGFGSAQYLGADR